MDLSMHGPVCLPEVDRSMIGQKGQVYGRATNPPDCYSVSITGWGDTGVEETSTDRLQEATVPIVPTNNCVERMKLNPSKGVDETLILCVGSAEKGPCKVDRKAISP